MSIAVKTYVHRSRNSAGKLVKGRLDAASEAAALTKLRGMGLVPVAIDEHVAGTGLQREIEIPGLSKGVGLKDLAIVSRQLATGIRIRGRARPRLSRLSWNLRWRSPA